MTYFCKGSDIKAIEIISFQDDNFLFVARGNVGFTTKLNEFVFQDIFIFEAIGLIPQLRMNQFKLFLEI